MNAGRSWLPERKMDKSSLGKLDYHGPHQYKMQPNSVRLINSGPIDQKPEYVSCNVVDWIQWIQKLTCAISLLLYVSWITLEGK